jgi:hypothetical protein
MIFLPPSASHREPATKGQRLADQKPDFIILIAVMHRVSAAALPPLNLDLGCAAAFQGSPDLGFGKEQPATFGMFDDGI